MVWQPIETAPTDGTSILLLIEGKCVEGLYCRRQSGEGEWYDVFTPPGYFNDQPTHWMPLPKPPNLVHI